MWMRNENKWHRLFNFRLDVIRTPTKPRKGLVGVNVGIEGEKQQRFMVPVEYFDHPLFLALLTEAESEYGFDHPGAIRIPCRVDYFRHILGIIDRDSHGDGDGDGYDHRHRRRSAHHRSHGYDHHHRLANFIGCFRA